MKACALQVLSERERIILKLSKYSGPSPTWRGSFPFASLSPPPLRVSGWWWEVTDSWQQALGGLSWDGLLFLQFLPQHTPLPFLFPTPISTDKQRNKGNSGKGWALEPNSLRFNSYFCPFEAMQMGQFASPLCILVSSFILITPRSVRFLPQRNAPQLYSATFQDPLMFYTKKNIFPFFPHLQSQDLDIWVPRKLRVPTPECPTVGSCIQQWDTVSVTWGQLFILFSEPPSTILSAVSLPLCVCLFHFLSPLLPVSFSFH